ncbi:MAG: CAP domain-containing protein [Bacteroidota bacterium]
MKTMYNIIIFIFGVISAYPQVNNISFADTIYPFSKWQQADIERANTAAKIEFLTDEEREIIFLCNLARINGKLFNETFLAKYIAENDIQEEFYLQSLQKTLKKTKKLQCFIPADDLFEIAKKYAIEAGEKGWEGHRNFNARFKEAGKNYTETGENCAYGFDSGVDIVFILLIDKNVANLGHRKNILNKNFSHIGVSIQPHKQYEFNCVMDFGSKVYSKK